MSAGPAKNRLRYEIDQAICSCRLPQYALPFISGVYCMQVMLVLPSLNVRVMDVAGALMMYVERTIDTTSITLPDLITVNL